MREARGLRDREGTKNDDKSEMKQSRETRRN